MKQEEHSSIHHYITYSIVTAEPALTFSSVLSTIRVWPITSGVSRAFPYYKLRDAELTKLFPFSTPLPTETGP